MWKEFCRNLQFEYNMKLGSNNTSLGGSVVYNPNPIVCSVYTDHLGETHLELVSRLSI